MALKSEQARVLRRRVLGGLIRNLLLFSGAFALACLAIETFMVPSIANWVADSTSSWRTLNSSEQFQQILTDQGLLDDANLFDLWVNEAVESGYSNDAGTIAEVQGEVNEMEDALAEYASMMADSPENAEAAAAYAKERAEKLGADVAVASGTNAAAIGDTSTFIDDVAPLDAETDGAPDDKTLWAVPLLPYQTILTAEGIFTDEASAAHAMAALRVSASLQELGLSLPEAQTFMPPETTVDVATRILVSAAVLGYDQPTLNDLLQSAFRQSQEQAYSAWLDLTSAEEARALGVSDDHPVWQVQYGEDGVYRMRDVATYTFVKSFKLPLALLVFVAGWLAIILRALNRSLRYFDELSGAVGRLLADKDAPIELPADLSIARNELAVIRSQSLADERAAHAAEQRKNELVAYLAHDIRTPLTSVLGYLDLLRETTDLPRDTLRKYAGIAYAKAERLESLINEFFEITRYNVVRMPIERERLDAALFCQQVAEGYDIQAASRKLTIEVDAPEGLEFLGDPDKLSRALGNVIRNAIAFADEGTVISVSAARTASLGGEPMVDVALPARLQPPVPATRVGVAQAEEDAADAKPLLGGESSAAPVPPVPSAFSMVPRPASASVVPGGQYVRFAVTDHGKEISKLHLTSIFDKFFREDSSRGQENGGAGLGLAIAKEIVQAHKGEIAAVSDHGVTTFTITLPLV